MILSFDRLPSGRVVDDDVYAVVFGVAIGEKAFVVIGHVLCAGQGLCADGVSRDVSDFELDFVHGVGLIKVDEDGAEDVCGIGAV